MRSTRSTSRTWWKTAPAQRVIRNTRALQSLRLVASSQCASCHNNSADHGSVRAKRNAASVAKFPSTSSSCRSKSFWNCRDQRGAIQKSSIRFGVGIRSFSSFARTRATPTCFDSIINGISLADIPPVNGKKLDCNYCHKPDPGGRYYQRITFAANCQACHSLQFDAKNPELKIPHGDVDLARTFLRTLPAQYGDYARLKKGITRDAEVANFVTQQIRQLRENISHRRRTGARRVLHDRSLQTAAANGRHNSRELHRLRFLS